MQHRWLLGCVVATAILLGADLLIHLLAAQLNRGVMTRFGEIPLTELVTVFVAMLAGAAIARRPFRWSAVGIATLVWLATVASISLRDPLEAGVIPMLRYSALGLVLSLLVAWLGASVGERLARPHPPGAG